MYVQEATYMETAAHTCIMQSNSYSSKHIIYPQANIHKKHIMVPQFQIKK